MDTALFSMQRNDEFIGIIIDFRLTGGILHLCVSTWSAGQTCHMSLHARWQMPHYMKVDYAYHPNSSPKVICVWSTRHRPV